jgi:chemotaxis protein CheZ
VSSGTFDPEQLIVERLQGKAAELASCLERRDMSGAFSVIENINAVREESIYYGLGLLARGLHTAIVTFEVDDHGKHYLAHDETGTAGLTSQLDNVVRMSEESARKTLNILDTTLPQVRDLRASLEQEAVAASVPPAFLQAQRAGLEQVEHNLMDILMAQGFQDLSGQAIRKVNGILGDLQKDLIALLTYANHVKSMSQTLPVQLALADAEPAEKESEETQEAALSQGSVDDLLASLGF